MTTPLTEFEKHIARDLQKVCKDEDNINPKLTHCQDLVRKHQDAARAAGNRRRQEIASFIFVMCRDSLHASAAEKAADVAKKQDDALKKQSEEKKELSLRDITVIAACFNGYTADGVISDDDICLDSVEPERCEGGYWVQARLWVPDAWVKKAEKESNNDG